MLKLWKRKDSPYFFARGTHLGIRVGESLRTRDRAEAQRLLAKLQAKIFEEQMRGPVPKALAFGAAARRYMQGGGERRFMVPLLAHFGDTPIDQIDQAAIDNAAEVLYPECSPATRNRRVHTPVSAIFKRAGIERDIKRPKVRVIIRRALTWDEA